MPVSRGVDDSLSVAHAIAEAGGARIFSRRRIARCRAAGPRRSGGSVNGPRIWIQRLQVSKVIGEGLHGMRRA